MTTPLLLTADEVRDMGLDPTDMEPVGTYYDPKTKDGRRMLGHPLYASYGLRSRVAA